MLQVTFSDQAIAEMNKLPTLDQVQLMHHLSEVTYEKIKKSSEIGSFNRDGIVYHRLRANEFRVYFEVKPENILYTHYILTQHSLTDFLFRFKLPISEEMLFEQHPSFWKYLETLQSNSHDE